LLLIVAAVLSPLSIALVLVLVLAVTLRRWLLPLRRPFPPCQAEMVFTTLSSSARDILGRLARPFELVLIDEAAQAAEVAALQPLVYGAQVHPVQGRAVHQRL